MSVLDIDNAMVCVTLFSVEPTDRALVGWQPFPQGIETIFETRNDPAESLMCYFNYAGGG